MTEDLILDGQITTFGTDVTRCRNARSGSTVMQAFSAFGEQGIGISVRTIPRDSCGAAHVVEHCVLFAPILEDGGSIADLARECGFGVNAVTTHCHTTFFAKGPRSSSFADFARKYIDTVFHAPLNEELFRKEGIDLSQPGGASGVVYNEMRDLYASADHHIRTCIRGELYGDGPLAFDPGGAPSELSALTYENVLAFRREFYRPERALLFLAGAACDRGVLSELAHALPAKTTKVSEDSVPLRVGTGPSAPRSLTAAYPCIAEDDASYMVLSWRLASDEDEQLSWDWDLLERLLFRDRLSRIMRPIRERWSSATPFDIGLERTGPCLSFHFGVGIRQAPDAEAFSSIAREAIQQAFAEVRPQDVTAAVQHSLVDSREAMGRTLNLLAWINGPWAQSADPLVYANPEARAQRALARYAVTPSALFDRLRQGLFENPQVVKSSWRPNARGTETSHGTSPQGYAPPPARHGSHEQGTVRGPQTNSESRAAVGVDLPASPPDYTCCRERLGGIDVLRNTPHLEGVAYVAVDVELSHFAATEHRDLALVAMLIDRFASGQRPLSDVLVSRKELLSAYLAIPYAARSMVADSPPVVGLRFAVKCPEQNFEHALTTLEELLFLPLNHDAGLAQALPARVVEQQRGFIRNGFFSLVQFASLARVSLPARTKYHWSGQGLIERATSALRHGDLVERILTVRARMRRGRFRVSFTGADASFSSLCRRLEQWNRELDTEPPTASAATSVSPTPCFEVFEGAPGAVHFSAAMALPAQQEARCGLAEVAVKALSDARISPLLRDVASAYGASLAVDAAHGAVLLGVRSAAALSPVLEALHRLPSLVRDLRSDELNDAIRSCAAQFLVVPQPGDATMTSLDRELAGATPARRLQQYREIKSARLDGAQELLTSLFDEPDRFCALATACPRSDVPVALAARGTRELREVPVHELLRLEPSLSAAST